MLNEMDTAVPVDFVTRGDEHQNVATLREIYSDLRKLSKYAHEDIILHLPERSIPGAGTIIAGRETINKKQIELTALAKGALKFEVEHIFANDYFGTVIGKLVGQSQGRAFHTPICGLWRFDDGSIVEVWENAYYAELYHNFMVGLSARSHVAEEARSSDKAIPTGSMK